MHTAWKVEIVWWIFTGLALWALTYPITRDVYEYAFIGRQLWLILIAITFVRFILMFKISPYKQSYIAMALISIGAIAACIYSIRNLSLFQNHIDEQGLNVFTQHLPDPKGTALGKYLVSLFLTTATISMVTSALMPFQMVRYLWKKYNINR
jgi:hypothetical protein